jgi:hypothetical protein
MVFVKQFFTSCGMATVSLLETGGEFNPPERIAGGVKPLPYPQLYLVYGVLRLE